MGFFNRKAIVVTMHFLKDWKLERLKKLCHWELIQVLFPTRIQVYISKHSCYFIAASVSVLQLDIISGKHISPEEFHEAVRKLLTDPEEKKNTVLVDCRNFYESKVVSFFSIHHHRDTFLMFVPFLTKSCV